ncbi:MAG: hypothetical protein PWQ91_1028 [Eubacteriales bacterium]|nr:hypothetical protein [Eubacteriales bacterium]MDN5363967.1 hypothetical protein [Eubacteriales bacterium]
MEEDFISRVPWSVRPSLKAMTEEVGVDFNRFLEGLKNNRSDAEMAAEFGVTEKTISYLRDHFYRYGLGSIMGQD